MKHIHILISVFFILLSCQKVSHNGHLDGMWQLMTIDWNNGESQNPERMYYSIQLNLINLRQIGSTNLLGYFRQTEDSLYISMRNTTVEKVIPYGLSDTIQSFAIEELTKKKMILRSTENRLYFRKF